MNTTQQITEADVVAWLKDQVETMSLPEAKVLLWNADYSETGVRWLVECRDARSPIAVSADTLAEALANTRKCIKSPAALAAEKRAAAEKLLAEAEALHPEDQTTVRDEPDYDAPRPLTPLEN